MFVLNIEVPKDQVDVMAEPDKTWVEFSDWPAARNACIAMLLVRSCLLEAFPRQQLFSTLH